MAEGEQLQLVRASLTGARRPRPGSDPLAADRPVASVLVDTGLPHLDRPFEYLVPERFDDAARPGVRVKVRFAGKDRDGFLLARADEAEHEGRLSPLRRVVSDEPVLTPAVLAAARAVADRYAGTVGDVVRLAVPPRHARAEAALPLRPDGPGTPGGTRGSDEPGGGEIDHGSDGSDGSVPPAGEGAWRRYPAGPALLHRLRAGEAPWAAWTAAPSADPAGDWPRAIAEAAAAALSGGRGSVLVLPDRRDVERVDAALTDVLGRGGHVRLTADQGPQARYTAFLKVLRGHVRVVVGTRAAALAPVRDPGLLLCWDDGDDLHEEPRAPYPHVREVLLERARAEDAALVVGGFSRTTATAALVDAGTLKPVAAERATLRGVAPRVRVAGEGPEGDRDPAGRGAHLPTLAWRTAKEALREAPVLVQVPRRGYLPAVSCQGCRAPARCTACHGPLALADPAAPPACRWCGVAATPWTCPTCGDHRLRAAVVGARRTAEEIGRAFPGVPVHTSGAGAVLETVPGEPALVIATPGAEPVAEGGYGAVLLLDAWALLDRPSLRAGEEAVRRWLGAAALARGAAAGGAAVLCGVPGHTTLAPVEAVVRWDPAWFAGRELAERRELALPPAAWMAQVTGSRRALGEVVDAVHEADLRTPVEVLGPLPLPPSSAARGGPPGEGAEAAHQVLLRAPRDEASAVARLLARARAARSARKEADTVRVRVDPPEVTA